MLNQAGSKAGLTSLEPSHRSGDGGHLLWTAVMPDALSWDGMARPQLHSHLRPHVAVSSCFAAIALGCQAGNAHQGFELLQHGAVKIGTNAHRCSATRPLHMRSTHGRPGQSHTADAVSTAQWVGDPSPPDVAHWLIFLVE